MVRRPPVFGLCVVVLCLLSTSCSTVVVSAAHHRAGNSSVVPMIPKSEPTTTAPPSLSGKVVVIDPGHNEGNFSDATYINQMVWNGREEEPCDTTGTETDGGFTEAQFNFNVALYLETDLQTEGARVILTRANNAGVGPCVTQRAAIGNIAHANAAISIHGDGGPVDGRGFAVLEPVADGINDGIIQASQQLGLDVRNAFASGTGMPLSTYDGIDGIQPRDDLAGLNLSTVPKILIECGNMRNSTDAAMLTESGWQESAASALAVGVTTFLTHPPSPNS